MNVTVFDTTLRDGEQAPGASMSAPDRLRVALALYTASPSVLASIRDISAQVRDAEVAAFLPLDAVGHRRSLDGGEGRAPAEFSFGRDSGRSGLRSRFERLGLELSTEELNRAYRMFLDVANESRNVDDAQMLHIALSASESALEISG